MFVLSDLNEKGGDNIHTLSDMVLLPVGLPHFGCKYMQILQRRKVKKDLRGQRETATQERPLMSSMTYALKIQ